MMEVKDSEPIAGFRYHALIHDQAKYIGADVHKACYIAVFDCCVAQM
jgi:hypothetical protein